MDKWAQLAAGIYYTGVGAILLCTTVRFFYRLIKGYDQDREFLEELKEVHLNNIYSALQDISAKLNFSLEIHPPKQQTPPRRIHGQH